MGRNRTCDLPICDRMLYHCATMSQMCMLYHCATAMTAINKTNRNKTCNMLSWVTLVCDRDPS